VTKKHKVIILLIISVLALAFYVFYTWYYQSVPQSGISLLNIVPDPKKSDTILIFSPHPDDESIATGGYIKTAINKGATVWIVLVTDGNKHHLEKTRYNEFAMVTASLGVPESNLIYLNYPDGSLTNEDQNSVQSYFKSIIELIEPNIIFVPDANDRHPDHKTTGLDAEKAISKIQKKFTIYYYLVHFPNFPLPINFNKNLYVLPPIKLLDFSKEWLSFPLKPDVEEAKYNALMEYKTQLKYPIPKELILSFIRKNELFVINK
jgi:LmbE family N-acetylglucosaminyl deacetylase